MKNIFVVTSTRADYGLLKPVLFKISASVELNLILIATGTHLMGEFGSTLSEIEQDGFFVKYKPEIMSFGNDSLAVAKTISYTVDIFSQIFSHDRPDALVLLGDRYEIFGVATAASALGVPICHISGGDVTAGAKDDFYRHCITHMSSLHFPSCPDSYSRLLRLGQNPATVFNVGGLGDENIKNTPLLSREELESSLDFPHLTPFALITYHPETQKAQDPCEDMENLLAALDKTEGLNLLFTKANADAGGQHINQMVDDYCAAHPKNTRAFFSLGLKRYLSAMKYCQEVIGNSSSGVVETPTFKTPCVNIGDRQNGRFISQNIVCTTTDTPSITKGIERALSTEFKKTAQQAVSPYDSGCVPSDEIVKHITDFVYSKNNTIKIFYDGE
ncbi:MAG: UDP-N-acetylglucosamine 2-epimerase [Oscillospiraceae bacterium]